MIQPHHLHTHGPEPLYTPVKADDVRPKIDVRKFDIITHYHGEITIECVNPETGNTMEAK